MAEAREKKQLDKSVLSFFIIGFPTLLIIVAGVLMRESHYLMVVIIQIVLALYQFITLKQFLDNYYKFIE